MTETQTPAKKTAAPAAPVIQTIDKSDLIILWSVNDAFAPPGQKASIQINGKVYLKTSDLTEEPPMVSSVYVPKSMVKGRSASEVFAMVDERIDCDLAEINRTGVWADLPAEADVNVLRQRLGLNELPAA